MKFYKEELNKNKSGIYAIVNIQNKNVYIGQTKMRFIKRYWHHVWKLENNTHDNKYLQNAWNKYGKDSFVFKPIVFLDRDDPQDVFDEKEEFFIAKYKNRGGCYNILNNGTRKNLHCSEHAKKIIGEKNRSNMLGKKHSEETKRKMSATRTGQSYTRYKKTNAANDDTIRKIKIMLVNGVGSKEITEKLGVSYSVINNILSANAWSNIEVDGWDEFQSSRKKNHRASEEEILIYQDLFYNHNWTIHKISHEYNRSYDLVKRVVKLKAHDNTVPSLHSEEGQTTIP